MAVRIAIPEPTSLDPEYNGRSLPQYVGAITQAGAEPVVISLKFSPAEIAWLLQSVHGVLLPGSHFDADPERYGETRIAACAGSDAARTAADELLLQDAFNLHKPILGICYGTQSLNVWRNGSLIQDLREAGLTQVNHSPGRQVAEAHPVDILPGSRLASIVRHANSEFVNSSHHQAVKVAGDNLRITAVSPVDKVVEAVELDDPSHFVVGVQWHPERTMAVSELSRALIAAFVAEAESWRLKHGQEVSLPQ